MFKFYFLAPMLERVISFLFVYLVPVLKTHSCTYFSYQYEAKNINSLSFLNPSPSLPPFLSLQAMTHLNSDSSSGGVGAEEGDMGQAP